MGGIRVFFLHEDLSETKVLLGCLVLWKGWWSKGTFVDGKLSNAQASCWREQHASNIDKLRQCHNVLMLIYHPLLVPMSPECGMVWQTLGAMLNKKLAGFDWNWCRWEVLLAVCSTEAFSHVNMNDQLSQNLFGNHQGVDDYSNQSWT